MATLNINEVVEFVEGNIGSFHQKRLDGLATQKLSEILKRKNPYLFKARDILVAGDLVKVLLDAYLSSQEETMFGEFLERLAIFVAGKVYGGHKSSAEGIDLEFEKEGITYIIAVKSGPNWANSDQISKMKTNFERARKVLQTNNPSVNVRAINGCCYGRSKSKPNGIYQKLCGQEFWLFISGNDNLYIDIVEPLGHKAKEKNDTFLREYAKLLTKFTSQFIDNFCTPDGAIRWDLLIEYNSGRKRAKSI